MGAVFIPACLGHSLSRKQVIQEKTSSPVSIEAKSERANKIFSSVRYVYIVTEVVVARRRGNIGRRFIDNR